jgi:hypothetical protein
MSTISHHSAVVSAALNLSQLDPELLLIEAETAALTRRSPRTLESWRRDGVGPKWLKLGRSVCYRVRDVRDWLAAQEFGGQPHRSRVRSSSRDAQPSEGQSEDSTKCSAPRHRRLATWGLCGSRLAAIEPRILYHHRSLQFNGFADRCRVRPMCRTTVPANSRRYCLAGAGARREHRRRRRKSNSCP